MSFQLPKDPETSESLQCLACAGLQEIGSTFNVDDLRQLMIQGQFKKTAHEDMIRFGIELEYLVQVN